MFLTHKQSSYTCTRILQIPDVFLYGFQTLWDTRGGMVCRHTRYWNLWGSGHKQQRSTLNKSHSHSRCGMSLWTSIMLHCRHHFPPNLSPYSKFWTVMYLLEGNLKIDKKKIQGSFVQILNIYLQTLGRSVAPRIPFPMASPSGWIRATCRHILSHVSSSTGRPPLFTKKGTPPSLNSSSSSCSSSLSSMEPTVALSIPLWKAKPTKFWHWNAAQVLDG